MKRIATVVVLCLAGLAGYGQTSEVRIPGTGVVMVQPEGFKPATKFAGLQTEDAFIEVMELSADFQFIHNTFGTICQQEGYTIYTEKDTTVAGYRARLYTMSSEPEEMVQTVLFGNHSFTVMIKGSYPVDEEQTGEEMLDAILGARYEELH